MDPKIKLNVHLQVPSSTQETGGSTSSALPTPGSHTPNTPEILNSIMNMTGGPFAADFAAQEQQNPPPPPPNTITMPHHSVMSMEAPSPIVPSNQESSLTYTDMDTTSSNMSSSPASTPGSSLSVQAYTSQFIKEGLKIKMRQRIGSGSATPSPVKESVNLNAELEEYTKPKIKKIKLENLSPEDSVKRLRRRERNKIAATKCRNKKKARTHNLMKESDTLHAQNKTLKLEITKLEAEKSRLIDVLSRHQPNCAIKLKEIMKYNPSVGATSGDTNEFRVPLPPTSTMTSGGGGAINNATSSSTSGHLQQHQQLPAVVQQIPKIRISEPPQQEPPSFADLIKEEDDPDSISGAGYMDDASNNYYSHHPASRILNSDSMHHNTDSFYNSSTSHHHHHHPTNHFLAKTHLGQTYLDLDSRCIAL